MQMIRHKQAQAAVPDESLVVKLHGGEQSVAGIGSAQLILAARDAVHGDEEPTALGNPLRNCVRQLFADKQVHARSVAKTLARAQTKKARAGSPLRAAARTGVRALPFLLTNAIYPLHAAARTGVRALPYAA